MADYRKLAGLLTTAAGLAVEILAASEGRIRIGRTPKAKLPPEFGALSERVHRLAVENTGVARAILEENLALSIASDLSRMLHAKRVGPEQLLATSELELEVLEDVLAGASTPLPTLSALVRIASALDARVQVVFLPNLTPPRTEKDLAVLIRDAETLLPPGAAAP